MKKCVCGGGAGRGEEGGGEEGGGRGVELREAHNFAVSSQLKHFS